MVPVTNLQQLNQLMNGTMVYAIVVAIVALVVALIVANLFPWEGGNDRSYVKRRISYIVIGVVAVLGFWLYNDLVVAETIRNVGFQSMFKACNVKCLFINLGIYVVVGVVLMFVFRRSKFGSILGKIKK